jgi:hypothetical protein
MTSPLSSTKFPSLYAVLSANATHSDQSNHPQLPSYSDPGNLVHFFILPHTRFTYHRTWETGLEPEIRVAGFNPAFFCPNIFSASRKSFINSHRPCEMESRASSPGVHGCGQFRPDGDARRSITPRVTSSLSVSRRRIGQNLYHREHRGTGHTRNADSR